MIKKRIATNACNYYLKEMEKGKAMRCAHPKKIAEKMQKYLNVKCNYNEYKVWLENASQLTLF